MAQGGEVGILVCDGGAEVWSGVLVWVGDGVGLGMAVVGGGES